MSDPTTVNKTASIVAGILEQLASGAEDVVIAMILADTAEVVAIPVIGQLWTAIVKLAVNRLGQYFYVNTANIATKIIIDIQVSGEASSANEAFQNLQMAVASGDKNAIKTASDDMDKAYGDLVHDDGSFSP